MEEKHLPELPIGDDFLIQVANQAEKRIDAVIKIKQLALKVTNARDWTDQNGNPYLQSSGSEKVGNLFNISWRIDEPGYEEDPDGHYTYSYKGYFSLGGRTIEAEGSRSSKDPFFRQYRYKSENGKKLDPPQEIPVTERSNKRDVKMAAFTNLLGNGITRILGIRNLTWDDLSKFAGITKEQVTSIQYGKGGEKPPINTPQEKGNGQSPPDGVPVFIGPITEIDTKSGGTKDKPWTLYIIHSGDQKFSTFDKKIYEAAKTFKESKTVCEITFEQQEKGKKLTQVVEYAEREIGEEG